MDATFTIPAKVLLGMSHLVSGDATRYNLTGVLIEKRDGDIRIVATDGHLMGIYNARQDGVEWFDGASGYESANVNLADFVSLLKDAKKNRIDAVKVSLNGTVKMEYFGKTVESEYAVGSFPDWERCVPEETDTPTPHIGIQLSLLDKFKKCLVDLSGSSKGIYLRMSFTGPESQIKITSGCDPNFTGILMPSRS
jgi:DNA polymerase III sliding clamp (beta) subunit (PCNA family)